MKAISILPGSGNIHLAEVEEPEITRPNEVKAKILQVGICGTVDWT